MKYSSTGLLALFLLWAGPLLSQEPESHGHHHGHDGHHGQHGQHLEPTCHDLHHDFSDAEKWSERFDSPERQEWQKPGEVVELMEIEPGMTVAELGAGTGYFLGHLSQAVGETGRVLGLDVEENLVEFMKERAAREGWVNVEPRRVPYDDPELADGTVDRVLIVDTWHHIEDRGAYSAKLLRALAPGGRVYVVDFTKDSPSGPPVEHRVAPEQVIGELEQGGLEAEVVEETLPRQYIVVAERPSR